MKLPRGLQDVAECRPINGVTLTHLFYSDKQEKQSQAKNYCFACPVMLECLRYGLDEDSGVWGGLAEGERRKVRAAITEHGLKL